MLTFLLINRVGSAIIGSMLNKPSTDVICMKWRHHYDVIIVTSSCDVTCHKHGRFLHQNFDFDSVFLSSEWKYAFETSHICYSKGFAFVHWVATIINVIMMSYKQLKVKNVKNMGDCGKYLKPIYIIYAHGRLPHLHICPIVATARNHQTGVASMQMRQSPASI